MNIALILTKNLNLGPFFYCDENHAQTFNYWTKYPRKLTLLYLYQLFQSQKMSPNRYNQREHSALPDYSSTS